MALRLTKYFFSQSGYYPKALFTANYFAAQSTFQSKAEISDKTEITGIPTTN